MGGTGTGAGELIKAEVKNFDVLAGPMVSLGLPSCCDLFCSYASIMEIENKSRTANDHQWLTYWILYSMITLFELSFAKFIEWIPLWSYVKFLLVCWLVIPYFNGAALVYHHYLKPAFVNYRGGGGGQSFNFCSHIPWRKEGIFGNRKPPDDILTAVEKYIKENGTEGLEKLIHRADQNTWHGDMCYTSYTEDYTGNTYNGNMCYPDYNKGYTWNNTRYGDTDYNYNEDYTYRSFGD